MEETILAIETGPYPKKYTAVLRNRKTGRVRRVHFGDRRYKQYKDRTSLRAYNHLDHGDRARMSRYYSRHSGVKTRKEGLEKERLKARKNGRYTAKLLSHTYLW